MAHNWSIFSFRSIRSRLGPRNRPPKWKIAPLRVISLNQIGKPPSCRPRAQNYEPQSANQECNSGINPQSSQQLPTEEPLRIENVAHSATNSPSAGRWWPKRIDLPRTFPQCSTWNTIRVSELYCAVPLGTCPLFAMGLHCRAALQASQTFQVETISSCPYRLFCLVFAGTSRARPGSSARRMCSTCNTLLLIRSAF